ncbi:hypothetical protein MTP99_012476 [Tenebrio molitor]|nr:hypothetical protein MTP99_012476 [Tenebrio molitor]
MANLPEVPTEELLSFQDYPTVHSSANPTNTSAQLNLTQDSFDTFNSQNQTSAPLEDTTNQTASKSFWTLEYYQQFFDVDTKDVVERIIASVTPKRDNTLKYHLREKPDLLSRHKFVLMIGIISCHLLLAAGFMLYFFHAPEHNPVVEKIPAAVDNNVTKSAI